MAALGGARAAAQPSSGSLAAARAGVLPVPFLSQSELLCGGAAAAMVERWWGRRGVYAEDYAALVHPERGGILTTDLAAAVRSRGWSVQTFEGSADLVRGHLSAGAPVVALIEVARSRFHYVVIIAWSDGQVVFHDPARSPSRTLREDRFLAAWTGADRWAMVMRPGPSRPTEISPEDSGGSATAPPAVAELLATRELAGERFRQGRYQEAIGLAREYLARAPGDRLGWQLLAASRYLNDDRDGALAAWNRIGRPRVDLLRVDGSRSVRYRVITDATGVQARDVLTPGKLALARRRVAEIPALSRSAVEYRPIEGGEVELSAAVVERPLLDSPRRLAAVGIVRAVAQDEALVEVATPAGAGERWSAGVRWEPGRPGAAIALEVPARLGLNGIVRVSGEWLRSRFALDTGPPGRLVEERRTAALGMSGWLSSRLRVSTGVRFDRWTSGRSYLSPVAGGEVRAAGDRFTLALTGAHAFPLLGGPRYWRGGVGALWVSSAGLARAAWSARAGVDAVSPGAPLSEYPIAGATVAWAVPLRAHRPIEQGSIVAGRAGRRLLSAGVAADLPIGRLGPLVLALGGFLDGARVVAPASGSTESGNYLDAGGGVRLGLAGGRFGVLRVDLATGLADRTTALTAGVARGWPLLRPDPR